jgi:hypothetical protein
MAVTTHEEAMAIVTNPLCDWIQREEDGVTPQIHVLTNHKDSCVKLDGDFNRTELEALVFLMKEKEAAQ